MTALEVYAFRNDHTPGSEFIMTIYHIAAAWMKL